MAGNSPLDRLSDKLGRRYRLDAEDEKAIRALPFNLRTVDPAAYLIREGERPVRCAFIVEGFAYRQKLTATGERQIVALMIPGDLIDLQNLFLDESDHNVQALTRLTVAEIMIDALQNLTMSRPSVGRALFIDALIDASVFREWIVNVGRRDARARVGHILCEFALRLEVAGIATDGAYELPMTQEQLADAVGLTPVHVNRVLRSLTNDGLINRDRRQISAPDWSKLRDMSDFSARYLHLEQAAI